LASTSSSDWPKKTPSGSLPDVQFAFWQTAIPELIFCCKLVLLQIAGGAFMVVLAEAPRLLCYRAISELSFANRAEDEGKSWGS
jgi:hypothetical protein